MTQNGPLTRRTRTSPRKFSERGKRAKQRANRRAELASIRLRHIRKDNTMLGVAVISMLAAVGVSIYSPWAFAIVLVSVLAMARHQQLKARIQAIEDELISD